MVPPIHLGAWSMALMLWLPFELLLLLDDGYKQHQPVPGPFPLALLVLRQRSPCYASESSDGERVEGQVRGSRAWKGGVDVKTSPFFLRPAGRAEEGTGTESPHRTSPRNAICSSLPTEGYDTGLHGVRDFWVSVISN